MPMVKLLVTMPLQKAMTKPKMTMKMPVMPQTAMMLIPKVPLMTM